jgi:hypothetical protein
MKVDVSGTNEASSQSFDPVPEGWYDVIVTKVWVNESEKGDTYWGLEFEIVNGDFAERKIFDNLFFTEKTKSRLKLILKRLGYDVERPFDLNPDSMIGRECRVEVEIQKDVVGKGGVVSDKNKVTFAGYDYPTGFDGGH